MSDVAEEINDVKKKQENIKRVEVQDFNVIDVYILIVTFVR